MISCFLNKFLVDDDRGNLSIERRDILGSLLDWVCVFRLLLFSISSLFLLFEFSNPNAIAIASSPLGCLSSEETTKPFSRI